ncbi:rhomboid family intramembrane serine protease [filamentous cyanobacterium CCP3]|nr:rhomboid family intramembrane serine protease [filamentous cyanobacterium CCP3]
MLYQGLRPYLPFLLVSALAINLLADWPYRLLLLSRWVAAAWIIHALNRFVFNGGLSRTFGLKPRKLVGLPGILASPLLHDCGLDDHAKGHIFYNTFAFLFTGWLLLLNGFFSFYVVSLFVILFGGFLTWLLGRPGTNHVGASGVINGYTGFLLIYGLVILDVYALIITFAIALERLVNTLRGLSPKQVGVSWEMHLFSFLGGVVAAVYFERIYNWFVWLEWYAYVEGWR